MKKFIALPLVVILLAVFSACGNEKGKAEKYCWNCGAGITTEVSFCSNCGAEIKGNQGALHATTTSTQSGSNTSTEKPVVTDNTASTKPAHTHVFLKATCESPATCSCGATQGSALGHNWETATKEKPKTCSVCKKVDEQDEATKIWFVNQYNLAKAEYIDTLEKEKASKQDEILDLKIIISSKRDSFNQEVANIYKRYPASLTRDTALKLAEGNYEQAINPYQTKITRLNTEIEEIDAKISNPSVDSILFVVTKNSGITSQQTYQYYSQYKNCIG